MRCSSFFVAAALVAAVPVQAAVIFSQDFETPAFTSPAAGSYDRHDSVLPAGFAPFRVTTYGIGTSATALPSPADGSQFLFLSGTNSGVFAFAGVIQADTSYTLSASIGNLDNSGISWSLQLFANAVGDTFIGQQFAQTPTALIPAVNMWATNSFTFDSAAIPGVVGQQLVVFLNNYRNTGDSYYDNVTVTALLNGGASPIPEPPALASLIATMCVLFGIRAAVRRRG